jgi:predicted ATPase/DNA-binding SARP family transcriptional activator
MSVEIRLLGGFEVVVDDVRVPDQAWRRRHAAALVKLLAISPGRRLLRDRVIDHLWPELSVKQAMPRLHKAAHYARHSLGVEDGLVLATEMVLLLPEAAVTVDVERFDAAAEAAVGSGDLRKAAEAVELYRGDLLPEDLYEPWTEQPRESRRLRYLQLLGELGRWDEVVDADPLDEQAQLRLVRDQLSRGDRTGALRSLERMERIWRQELDLPLPGPAVAVRDEASRLVVEAPPATSRWGRTPLPSPLTPTVGRREDVAQVLGLMERSRIVTLLGPGGVGKTRLALEAARRYGEASAVATCFVDLTKVDRADLVPDLVVQELGVRLSEDSAPEAVLREALRGGPLLVLLDNFEHVVEGAPVVSEMVRWSPVVRVLATSRARLHVTGEQVFEVLPLPLTGRGQPADAVALFEQVATSVDPDFRLGPHRDTVADICRTVDGLPLGIELAASHVRTLPPTLLLSRIRARLGSPTAAARDLPQRQQTIPATIDWSLQLLGDAERRLFAGMGVFSSPVPLDAIERVCGEPGSDALDALSRLVDQSLVRRLRRADDEPRFGMLELLRERARELLGADGLPEARERHARYVADVLDDLDERRWTVAAHRWIDDITAMLTEVRSAHEWARENGDVRLAARLCADLGTYWHREGHHQEGRRWVAESLAVEDQLDSWLLGRVQLSAAFVEWTRDPLTARQRWADSARRFRELGDLRYLAYSLGLGAGSYIGEVEGYAEGIALVDEGIRLARQVGEKPLIAQALNVKGELARVNGDDRLALEVYLEARDLAEAAGDLAHLAMLLANLSYLAVHRGDHAEAWALGREALRLSWSQGRRMMTAWVLAEMAGPYLGFGRADLGARLVGTGYQALALLGVDQHVGDAWEHERVVAGLRAALGDDRYEQLVAEGAQLSLDEAVPTVLDDETVPPRS